MVTQVQIARVVGLDVSSVNKILNKVPGPVFAKETKQRVFKVAKRMGYDFGRETKPQLKRKIELMGKVIAGNELAVQALRRMLLKFVPEADLDRQVAEAMKSQLLGEGAQKIA